MSAGTTIGGNQTLDDVLQVLANVGWRFRLETEDCLQGNGGACIHQTYAAEVDDGAGNSASAVADSPSWALHAAIDGVRGARRAKQKWAAS